jgi:hypothetical protein
MVNSISPVVGQWYRHLDKGETFQVIDVDAGQGRVALQYFDGDIEDMPRDEWHLQKIEACAPPENWTGPYDDVETDDLGYSETEMSEQDWRAPVEGTPPRPENWENVAPEDERAD